MKDDWQKLARDRVNQVAVGAAIAAGLGAEALRAFRWSSLVQALLVVLAGLSSGAPAPFGAPSYHGAT